MKHERPVVITGSSSFLGSHIARYFAEKGHRVVATHSRPLGSYSGIEAERLALAAAAGVQFELLDMTDAPAAGELIQRLEPAWWVSHAGWVQDYTSDNYDLVRGHVTHLTSYDTVVRSLKEYGAAGILSTGSSMEYSAASAECHEDDRAWPTTPYGLSKLCKTIRLQQLAQQHELPIRVARVFTPYGLHDTPAKLMATVGAALLRGQPVAVGAESSARDFIWVRDVCRAYLSLLHDLSRPSLFDVFNVSGGQGIPLGTMLRRFAEELGADPSLIHFGEHPTRASEASVQFGSVEKIHTLVGWRPEPWEESLARHAAQLRAAHETKSQTIIAHPPLIRLSRSSVDSNDVSRLASTARRGFLGMGTETHAFEREVATFIGGKKRHVLAVSSGTAALHLALQACGIGPGDEVLVPTLTYVASFQAISATGATPVACDVRETDCLLDLADATRRITARTRAIMPVHYASNPALLDEVYLFARRYGLRVVEDAAHAFGCRWRGEHIGATGDFVCFSFDGIKNITCGEGGAIVTGDDEAAERIRNARLLGVLKDTEKRYTGQRSWDYDVTAQGWRYHMSNLNAALGRSQLRAFTTRFENQRVTLAKTYRTLLGDIPGLRMLPIEYDDIVPHLFPIFVAEEKRDALRETLRLANIETGIHYKPNHLLAFYGGGSASLPVAERLYTQILSIPLHSELTASEQQRVADTLRTALL